MLGQRKEAFYLFSSRTDTKSSSQDQSGSSCSSSSSSSGSSSKGASSSSSSGGPATSNRAFGWTSPFSTRSSNTSAKNGGGFRVSNLGFKFDVANFDINAVSPTSW